MRLVPTLDGERSHPGLLAPPPVVPAITSETIMTCGLWLRAMSLAVDVDNGRTTP